MDGDGKKPLRIIMKIMKIKVKHKNSDVSVIKMFDHLIVRVHMANQNGLQSLQKI